MEKIVEMRLNSGFMDVPLLKGRIHSIFKRALNIEFFRESHLPRLITVLPADFTGVPDSLVVDTQYFSRLSSLTVGTAVEKRGLDFCFEGMEENLTGDEESFRSDVLSCSNHIKPDENRLLAISDHLRSFRSRTEKQDGFSQLPASASREVMERLDSLCRAILEEDPEAVEKNLSLCTGFGYGLTPSSDDAVVGILAAAKSGLMGVEMPLPDSYKIWSIIDGRTTDVSRKYICCAVEGRFSEALGDLMRVFVNSGEPEWKQYTETVSLIGSTSGMDMLRGIERAIMETLTAQEEKNVEMERGKNEAV